MTDRYTRTGVRRAGDDYQDLVALDLLVEMLEHPSRYVSVAVEADDFGALDDVVAHRTDGKYLARQVKYSAHPDAPTDPWTWEALLRREPGERGPRRSLLQKWSDGLKMVRQAGPIAEASVYSNRRAAAEILAAICPDGHIDSQRITAEQTWDEIIEQLGTEEVARSFLAEFRFLLDQPHPITLEEGLRRRFFKQGGDEVGWLSLKEALRLWIMEAGPLPDRLITIADVRNAARWYRLQSLPEDFEVPADYVLPSRGFHERFLCEVLSAERPCIVLSGHPGLGKSTYLSYLHKSLLEQDIPVVRHHYFLSTDDKTVGRLDHKRVAEALISEIAGRYPEALGTLANQNPAGAQLSDWLTQSGRHFSAQGKKLVVHRGRLRPRLAGDRV